MRQAGLRAAHTFLNLNSLKSEKGVGEARERLGSSRTRFDGNVPRLPLLH